MHYQVGIAANGTRKVAIARRGKCKVALVARLVQCALHTAQQQRVDEWRVSRTGCGINRRLQLVGASQSNACRATVIDDAQLCQRHGGTVQAVGTGIVVHAIAGLDIAVGQPLRHALVGQQHGFLNQRRGARALTGHNLHGHAVLVQQCTDLGRVKVDRTACATNTTAKLGELVGRY